MILTYRARAFIEDLAEGECAIRQCGNADGARWWILWFYVRRETDGALADFAVPVIPGGVFTESGPGGRSWGLVLTSPGVWQVSPSINVLDHYEDGTHRIIAGQHPVAVSLWHQTPAIVGVPAAGESWMP